MYIFPEIFLSIMGSILLLFAVILKNKKISQLNKITYITSATLFVTAICCWYLSNLEFIPVLLGGSLCVSSLKSFIKFILLISSSIVLLLHVEVIKHDKIYEFEFTSLVLFSSLGMMILLSANDLLMFYLGIELLSLSFYILAGIKRKSLHSTEASLKYFLLGALSSGLLLFGIAIIYMGIGTINFIDISNFMWHTDDNLLLFAGTSLITIALLFKLAAAPFHMWAPDVYEGSPISSTTYFAIVPKIAMLFVLFDLNMNVFGTESKIIVVASLLSLIVGSIGALNQTKIKRMIAYSAISHMGFLLLAMLGNNADAMKICLIYMIIYILISFNTFTLIMVKYKYGYYISQLIGLSRENRVLGMSFGFILLSIAGIPPLAGFYSKYLVLVGAISNEYYLLAMVGVLASCIGGFYYIRIIKWMFFQDTWEFDHRTVMNVVTSNTVISLLQACILGFTLFVTLAFLIYPNFLLELTDIVVTNSL